MVMVETAESNYTGMRDHEVEFLREKVLELQSRVKELEEKVALLEQDKKEIMYP